MARAEKTYPDRTLENALQERGIPFRCMWETKGPSNTGIAWITGFLIRDRMVIVQTFRNHGRIRGWEAYISANDRTVNGTIEEVIKACTAEEGGDKVALAAPSMLAALQQVVEAVEVPEANCSCHLSPPCSDCVDNGFLREVMASVNAAIAKAEGRA